MSRPLARVALVVGAAVATMALAACGGDTQASGAASEVVRLGYFPNLTHATPIVADKEGFFARHLGATTLKVTTFNAGPAAMEALKSGAIDAAYVGPGPATNGFLNSDGKALTVVAGAAAGGTSLVVDPSIKSAAALRGKTVSTPQLGNTQDIALRYWLRQRGLKTDLQGGGDVNVLPQENAQIVDAFKQKLIAGAWVPEPYATRLEQAGGTVLVDERDLWPDRTFAITVLAVRTEYLTAHPEQVTALLAGHLDATDLIAKNPVKAQRDVADLIATVSGKPIKPAVITAAWKRLEFTADPVPTSLLTGAQHAFQVGVLRES
ncbi:MAG TPA: ABC transporter substrate-binding protein, partial [Dermatophilaceae bacterium]|nr:ABC transporter substrate-binding protein [Dermatophilaceae bacterium]